ncbi:uncharacterized protein IL334_001867 [Kwoniella shivajii]|uniref:Uncharacterized protein n=1 Tax=Kwoniella shivajii TaxID=564305 RepID=A0ABZ1CT37_9TREE|nr:hypothetical protein IL334_001867 [Kwoniella shivajii]
MDAFYHHIVPLLPVNIQGIAYNPPNLSDPSSLINVVKLLFPYTKYIILFSAIWIVWSFLSGIFGMFSRVLRFGMKIGPLIGLVAWLMNSSGQGSMDELFGLIKQFVGLQGNNYQGNQGWAPGIASLASLFSENQSSSSKNKKAKSKYQTDPISSRTRNGKKASSNSNSNSNGDSPSAGDIFENLVNSATGNTPGTENDLGNVVQDFVKNSIVKAAGLEWLLGSAEKKQEEKSKGWKTR